MGKQLLAGALLQQASEGISAKQEAVQDLQDDLDFRQSFGVEASPLSEDPGISQKLKAWQNTKNENSPQPKSWLLYPLSALALGTLIYWGIYPSLKTFYVFSAAAFLNLTVGGLYFKNLKKDYQHLEGISKSLLMYSQMLSLIENRKHSSLLLQDIEAGLEHPGGLSSRALRKLSKILDGFDQLHNVVGALVMNALFMYHLHIWRKLRKWQCSYQTSIEDWLQVVGAFDHYCSLANYAFNHSSFSFPQISSQSEYVAHNMGHPFIRDSERVTNQCDFTGFKYVILTGSNMAGKSTYLKSLGVNLVLAKAGAPVCAGSMRCFPFQLLTSMNPEDSIQEGVSYFQAEVLRLKQIRQKLDEEKQCLVLLDEILRGTNSDDKRKGTRLFMQSLSKYNALGVIATHDVDIATLAEDQPQIFNARFFESQFIDGQLSFDYKLRQGVCATPNATELMRAHGII
ncbi:MAG: hypothetical protein U5L96_10725 [Owenweeksia sp.]|nr:hypothetical protein [Owenweeksia sp.]